MPRFFQGKNLEQNLSHDPCGETSVWSYLNLGLSLVTTPISSSLALKSTDRTEDRQEMANWIERTENTEKILY